MSSKHRFATEEIEKFSTVDLIAELKRRYQVLSRPERSCVLVGPDYSGVETQSGFLKKEWGLCNIKRSDFTDGANNLDATIEKLSDEIGSFRCRRGFALSNFPETGEEARAFESMIASKHPRRSEYRVFMLDLPCSGEQEKAESMKVLEHRAMGMLLHPSSGRVYNSNDSELAPQTPNVDDISGEPLVCPKWNVSNIRAAIDAWWNVRRPEIISFYGSRCKIVNASLTRDAVSVEISSNLLEETKSISKHTSE